MNIKIISLLVGYSLTAISSLSTAQTVTDICPDQATRDEIHSLLTTALKDAQAVDNGGFGFHMWAVVVNRDGLVCAVTHSGDDRGDQWPGSRVIAAQKANTANAFSLPGFALSTANLHQATQDGGSLF
ncbi:MAG: heme-binding protein, partial [Methylococcales bacterium]|nr:heme-binding protein [Methylococcales bacterium]